MKVETKVGLIFLVSVGVVVIFAYLLGALNPFSNSNHLNVLYNFAGGIEIGSPVRVMGIKVGKVESIDFDPNLKTPEGEEVKLKIKISVSKKAWQTVRKDSKFYINLAGIIGEKFLEITPGQNSSPVFNSGDSVRGEDPPRIDQLISQSYGLAGKIIELVEKNEAGITHTLETMDRLVTNLNKTLVQLEKTTKNVEINKILKNLEHISTDVASVTGRLRSDEAQKTIDLMHELLWRLKGVDGPAVKKFFQEEGIKARIF